MAAAMAGDPVAAMEQFNSGGADARIEVLADQLMGRRVAVMGDLDVVVDADLDALPLAVGIGLIR
jgi:hypothetical protein